MSLRTIHAAAFVLLVLLLLAAAPAHAQHDYTHYHTANATNYCQAFTPGPSNTIRNRAAGMENIGSAPLAVACSIDHHTILSNAFGVTVNSATTNMGLLFTNNGAQTVTVPCTLLVGTFNSVGNVVNRTRTLAAGASDSITFTAADTGTVGFAPINFNCTLAPNIVLSRIQYSYQNDY